MRYRSGEPPLPSDVMPEERDEDDGQDDDSDHAEYLRAALNHAKESARHLRKALDLLDAEALGGPDSDADGDDGDNVSPNPQDRRARMHLVATLLRRSML